MADRSVARHGYPVVKGDAPIGIVTSGTFGPSVERSIAMAYVATAHGAIGTEIGVEIRGQAKAARVVKTPFHPSRVKKG
jgi:aminomethyltransferase